MASQVAESGGRYSGTPLGAEILLFMSLSKSSGDSSHSSVFEELEQEGVGRALAADGGLVAVPREHHDVVGQREHLGAQAAQHRRMVAAREVGASDGALEEEVPGEHDLGDLVHV